MYECKRNYDTIGSLPCLQILPHYFICILSRWGGKSAEQNLPWHRWRWMWQEDGGINIRVLIFLWLFCMFLCKTKFLTCGMLIEYIMSLNNYHLQEEELSDLQTQWEEKIGKKCKLQGYHILFHDNCVVQVTLERRTEMRTQGYSIFKLWLDGRMKYCLIKKVYQL